MHSVRPECCKVHDLPAVEPENDRKAALRTGMDNAHSAHGLHADRRGPWEMRSRAISSVETRPLGASPPGRPSDGCSRAAILIVDNEEDVRTELATYLDRYGCAVETAADLPSALRTLARREFDVVFADVGVAGMSDAALLKQVRERHPDAAVVFITAHATVAQAVHAIRAGASDY